MNNCGAVLIFLLFTLHFTATEDIKEFTKNVSGEFGIRLLNKIKKVTNYENIMKDFDDLLEKDQIQRRKMSGTDMIKDFKSDIEALFRKKEKALKDLTDKAEEANTLHTFDEKIQPFQYNNMDTVQEELISIDPKFSLSAKVNMNESFVQVPINIYSGTKEILNAVNWTASLDEVFKNNYDDSNGQMLYQYLCDKSGMMRLYPGNTLNHGYEEVDGEQIRKVDLYDCTRKFWYTQSASSPKDVVFIIDMSGSMKGRNKGIARLTVKSLVDTLNDNDFFNIIKVNDKVEYLINSAKQLMPATKYNKEAMKNATEDLGKAFNCTPAEPGLIEAFKLFNKSSGKDCSHTTASCNKVIIFVSDGVEGDYVGKKVFDEYNVDKSVRVFVYMIGRKTIGKEGLLKMACENRGYFNRIETVGSIWNKTSNFIQVMSRPLFSSRDDVKHVYSPMYNDTGGLGMIISVSLSVFNDKEFIGVMAIDITLRQIKDKLPLSKFDPPSHIFMIDNNGYAVVHPKLYVDDWRMTDKKVFIDDIEHGVSDNDRISLKDHGVCDNNTIDNAVVLKEKMINHESGSMVYPIYYIYGEDRKLAQVDATAYYEPIDGTHMSVAAVITEQDDFYFDFTDEAANKWLSAGIDALREEKEKRTTDPIAEPTANTTAKPTAKSTDNQTANATAQPTALPTAKQLSLIRKERVQIERWEYCKKPNDGSRPLNEKHYYTANELMERLSYLKKENRTIADLSSNCDAGLVKRLLVSAGIINKNVQETWLPEVLNGSTYESVFTASSGYMKYVSYLEQSVSRHFKYNELLTMAAANPSALVSVSAPYAEYNKSSSGEDIYFTVTAAIRVRAKERRKHRKLKAVSGATIHSHFFYDLLSTVAGEESENLCHKNKSEDYLCLILDRNAYIIASNQDKKYTGTFLGEFSNLLIQKLRKIGVYKKVELKDTQVEKHSEDGKVSSCTKTTPYYVFQEKLAKSLYNKRGSVTCEKCGNMIYFFNEVSDTNMLYLTAKWHKGCRITCTSNSTKLDRITDEGAGKIFLHRYRKQPSPCFNKRIANESTMCGYGVMLEPKLWLLLVPLLFHLLLVQN